MKKGFSLLINAKKIRIISFKIDMQKSLVQKKCSCLHKTIIQIILKSHKLST